MKNKLNLHESMDERTEVKLGSERSLAIVFSIVFLIIAMWPLLSGRAPRLWAIGAGTAILILGFAAPKTLRPLNQLWFRFGMLLHRIINPLVMGIIFYGAVAPTGFVMRLLGKDPLKLKLDPESSSYWVKRNPPGPARDSFKNQF